MYLVFFRSITSYLKLNGKWQLNLILFSPRVSIVVQWFNQFRKYLSDKSVCAGLGQSFSKMTGFSKMKVTRDALENLDIDGPKPIAQFRGCRSNILGLNFHPALPQVAAGAGNGTVTIWSYDDNGNALSFKGHTGGVTDVQFSESGDLVMSGGEDQTVRIWIPTVGGEVRYFRGHTAKIQSVCFNPRIPGMIASCSNDKTIKLWSIDWKAKFPEGGRSVVDKRKLQKDMKGRWRSVGYIQTFLKSFAKIHRNWVRSVRFSSDGSLLISASDDRTVALIDSRSYELAASLSFHMGSPTYAEFDPCAGHYVGSSTTDGGFTVHDLRNRQPVQVFQGIHNGSTHKFAFHPSGDYAVTVGEDAVARVLDLVEGRPIYTLQGCKKDLRAVAFSKDGNNLAIGGDDKSIVLWRCLLETHDSDEDELTGEDDGSGAIRLDRHESDAPPSSPKSAFVWKEPSADSLKTSSNSSSTVAFVNE